MQQKKPSQKRIPKTLLLRMSPKVYDAIKKEAQDNGVAVTAQINFILIQFFQNKNNLQYDE